jgi:phage I-like protein
MSSKDDDLEIQIIDDEPKAPEPEVIVKEEEPVAAKAPEIEPKDGIEELSKRLEAEKQARIEAERRAREAAQMAARAKSEAEDTNLHFVTNVIETVKRENDILKANYRDAMSVGDYEKAAEIQLNMSENASRLLQLENGKAAMESRPKEQPQQYAPADPIDNLISQVSPASASWLAQNRDNLRNQKTIDRMFRAHADAVDDGIIPDTREYFEYIEGRLGFKQHEVSRSDEPAMSAASAPTQRRSSPAAAPVSRTGGGPGSRPNVVTLTAAEAEAARASGLTEKEYYLNKVALQKAGRM